MKIFSAFRENGLPHHWAVNCGNFECREIIDIFMSSDKLVRDGPQGGFGIAACANHVGIFTKGSPEVDRRHSDNDSASGIMFSH